MVVILPEEVAFTLTEVEALHLVMVSKAAVAVLEALVISMITTLKTLNLLPLGLRLNLNPEWDSFVCRKPTESLRFFSMHLSEVSTTSTVNVLLGQ